MKRARGSVCGHKHTEHVHVSHLHEYGISSAAVVYIKKNHTC